MTEFEGSDVGNTTSATEKTPPTEDQLKLRRFGGIAHRIFKTEDSEQVRELYREIQFEWRRSVENEGSDDETRPDWWEDDPRLETSLWGALLELARYKYKGETIKVKPLENA